MPNLRKTKTNTNKTDDKCSWDLLELKDFGLRINRGYRYIFVVIDNFPKIRRAVPQKSKNVQKKIHLKSSLKHRKDHRHWLRVMMEIKLQAKLFTDLLNNHDNKKGVAIHQRAVFAKRIKEAIRDFPTKPFRTKILDIG